MSTLASQYEQLRESVITAIEQLQIESKVTELEALDRQMAAPDFWSDQANATSVSRAAARLRETIEPWQALTKELDEINDFMQLKDESLSSDISDKLEAVQQRFDTLRQELRFSGPYDSNSAIVTIYAGAGGTDAQDWAEMLLRMYQRWADRQSFKVTELDHSPGEEAGLKSVTMRVAGTNAFGYLKGEHGVHRLVRMSPFNSAQSRETSFAMVEVVPEIDQPEQVVIDEKDLRIDVFRAGGHGGQSVNTTDSAVRVTHLPTNIVVSIQNERSQLQNKETALTILRSKLAQLALEQHQDAISELKGPNKEAAWGNQIRSYVLHPYTMVKDSRSGYETTEVNEVLNGGPKLDELIDAYLESTMGEAVTKLS